VVKVVVFHYLPFLSSMMVWERGILILDNLSRSFLEGMVAVFLSLRFEKYSGLLSPLKIGENVPEIKRGFTPPLIDGYGDAGLFQIVELGCMGYAESLVYFDPDKEDDKRAVDQFAYIEVPKEDIRRRCCIGL